MALPTLMEDDATKLRCSSGITNAVSLSGYRIRQQLTVAFSLLRNMFRSLPVSCNVVNKRGAEIIIIIIIIIIIVLQPFVGHWPLFQFLDPIHSW
jgi:hypothetical protein